MLTSSDHEQILDEPENKILRGYSDDLNKLKSLVLKNGFAYKIAEDEFHLLYWFFKRRGRTILKDKPVFRARIIYKDDSVHIGKSENFMGFCKEQCGAPPAALCKGLRTNPEYHRYLYCALDNYTALAEVRPYLHQDISVAKLELSKDIVLFDFTKDKFYTSNADDSYSYLLSREFSKPVADCESPSEYLFTQYISTHIKGEGFDGIVYKSASSDNGENIVLFDPQIAEPISSKLYTLRRVCLGGFDEKMNSSVQHPLLIKADEKVKQDGLGANNKQEI